MKKILIILIVILLSACSLSEYNNSMESGKRFLKNGEYEAAEKEFSDALIEKPSSEDAKSLLDKARQQKIESMMKEKIEEYILDNRNYVANLLAINSQTSEQLTVEIQKRKYDDLLDIQKKSGMFLNKYKEYNKIVEVHQVYLDSLKYQLDALSNVIALLESVSQYSEDEIINDPKVIEAQSNMKYYSDLSNEAIIKYSEGVLSLQNEYGVELDPTE